MIDLNCMRKVKCYRKTIVLRLLLVSIAQRNLFCFNSKVALVMVILCSRDRGTNGTNNKVKQGTEHADCTKDEYPSCHSLTCVCIKN